MTGPERVTNRIPVDALGEFPGGDLSFLKLPEIPPTLTEILFKNRPKINAPRILASIKVDTHFRERHHGWRLRHDPIGLQRLLPGGGEETYSDKLAREEAKGQQEAASLGTARIGKHPVVLFATHLDFFAGSVGVVVGDKLQEATDLAIREKKPLVAIYSSAGIRQHENIPGLFQMEKMIQAVGNVKKKSKELYVAVILGQGWGGISASAVPFGNIKMAFAGTDTGFSGPRVIETFEGIPVPSGAQSVEAHGLYRNLDVIVKDEPEFHTYMERLLDVTSSAHSRLTEDNVPDLLVLGRPGKRTIPEAGYAPLFPTPVEASPQQVFPQKEAPHADRLYTQYMELAKSADRPDAEFFMQHAFTDVVPLYNSTSDGTRHYYPAIIASIGRIGPQSFLILGTQSSYQKSYDGVSKIPSSPAPEDFKYMRRMLEMGEQLGLPAVFLTDTLGAKPTLEAERLGQSDEIAMTIGKGISYPHPVISVVIGAMGSGGGLTTMPVGERTFMLSESMAFVAEPRSAASILYNENHPHVSKVINTIRGLRATAHDQKALDVIDGVIPESDNPYETVKAFRDAVVGAYREFQDIPSKKLLKLREKKIREIGQVLIKKEL